MIAPSSWTFYGDVYSKTGKKVRFEFDVVEDRARVGDAQLGSLIRQTMDKIKMMNQIPAGGVFNRYGVYRGFSALFNGRWYIHRGLADYEVKRPYKRGFGGTTGAG